MLKKIAIAAVGGITVYGLARLLNGHVVVLSPEMHLDPGHHLAQEGLTDDRAHTPACEGVPQSETQQLGEAGRGAPCP